MFQQTDKQTKERPNRKPWTKPVVRSMISSRRTAGGPLSPTIVESAVYGIS